MSVSFLLVKREVAPRLQEYVLRYHQTHDDFVRQELAERFLQAADKLLKPIALWQSREFHFLGVQTEDLPQWGRVAALEALERYNPDRGADFVSYLIPYVKRYVYNKILDDLPIPRDVSKRISAALREQGELPQSLAVASMIRCPLQVESDVMERFSSYREWRDPLQTAEESEALQCIRQELGEALWQDLCETLEEYQHSNHLEYLVTGVMMREIACLQEEVRNHLHHLRMYLTTLLEKRYSGTA